MQRFVQTLGSSALAHNSLRVAAPRALSTGAYMRAIQRPHASPRRSPVDTQAIERVFHQFDTNRDGRLNVHDFTRVLLRLNVAPRKLVPPQVSGNGDVHSQTRTQVDDQAVHSLFQRMDVDNDGLVGVEEFAQGLMRLNVAPRKALHY